jgi:starch synthase
MAAPAVLHVAAEAYPLIKTGGLADVAGALPRAQRALRIDARLLVPGYPSVLASLRDRGGLAAVGAPFGGAFGAARVALLRGTLPESDLPVYVVDAPWLYARAGNPYVDGTGLPWSDNHLRFGLLGFAAAQLASGALDPEWCPRVVHAHDWHAGLAPWYVRSHPGMRAGTVFTIHNLAFHGRFALETGAQLGILPSQITSATLEFHGDLSFIKAGLTSADAITTVSPTYAQEILTPQRGEGLDGVLRERQGRLSGILNGVDVQQWNPATDPAIAHHYDGGDLAGKARTRQALRDEFGFAHDPGRPVFAVIGRLTWQKGLDLLLQAMAERLPPPFQLIVLGSGEPGLERAFAALAAAHPGTVAAHIGFDEALAHRIFAGADAIVVPSRFEPCGLTQLYGLRYGTVPIVRRVGGLADTVIDDEVGKTATGFVFDDESAAGLATALARALAAYRRPSHWQTLMRNGMRQPVSWDRPAQAYRALYERVLAHR